MPDANLPPNVYLKDGPHLIAKHPISFNVLSVEQLLRGPYSDKSVRPARHQHWRIFVLVSPIVCELSVRVRKNRCFQWVHVCLLLVDPFSILLRGHKLSWFHVIGLEKQSGIIEHQVLYLSCVAFPVNKFDVSGIPEN